MEWSYILYVYSTFLAQLANQRRAQCIIYIYHCCIILPLTNDWFLKSISELSIVEISFVDYYRRIGNHYPVGKIQDFIIQTEFVIIKIAHHSPIPQTDIYFIDGSYKAIGRNLYSAHSLIY